MSSIWRRLVMLVLLATTLGASAAFAQAGSAIGDEYMIVDCRLPGAVKRMGSRIVMAGRASVAKLPARVCEIRGGTYIAYDRANFDTSLQVWAPLAESGDPKAQTYLADIYAKGLGRNPDFATAARWYRRAADTGFRPAMFALGSLYETGQGVPRDPNQAAHWFRTAAGLPATAPVSFGAPDAGGPSSAAANAEVQRLRDEVRRLQAALDAARLDVATSAASAAAERAEIANLRSQLETQQAELARERQAAEAAARNGSAQSARLAESLRKREGELSQREAALAARETRTRNEEQSVAARQRQLAQLEKDLNARRESLAAEAPSIRLAPSAPPQIVMLDPEIQATRGEPVIFAAADASSQVISGRVFSGSRLVSLTINGQSVTPTTAGVFGAQLPVSGQATPVKIVAVDTQGHKGELSFEVRRLVREAARAAAQDRAREAVMGTRLGKFTAVLIANARYREGEWRNLESPYKDVDAIAALLRDRYGFEVKIVRDATRETIGRTFFELAQSVGENDSVMVYYAGHGAFLPGPVGNRGYWIPVDADKRNPTNWISAEAIHDWVGMMPARKVLVVSDSCFSGLLTREGGGFLQAAQSEDAQIELLRSEAEGKSRVYLTSGRDAPVLDQGGGNGHSVFARAFIEVLNGNTKVMTGRTVFGRVEQSVLYFSKAFSVTQQPDYRQMQTAGHIAGDFIFVPRNTARPS